MQVTALNCNLQTVQTVYMFLWQRATTASVFLMFCKDLKSFRVDKGRYLYTCTYIWCPQIHDFTMHKFLMYVLDHVNFNRLIANF